jgi:hypothetical protein
LFSKLFGYPAGGGSDDNQPRLEGFDARLPRRVYSVGLLGAKTEIPVESSFAGHYPS